MPKEIQTNPATLELAQRAGKMIEGMHCPYAIEYRVMPNKVGYPLTISGETVDGKFFSSAQWKGKVVLVDFWATWRPACVQGVPDVIKLYQKDHGQGLEIIGVSCDQERRALLSFISAHPQMTWPQLFAGGCNWHPLTRRFKVNEIPTMYLIDRNGILRTMNRREWMEQMVPELLREPAPSGEGTRKSSGSQG